MPLQSLKLPPPEPKPGSQAMPCDIDEGEKYPYGTRIEIRDKIIDRFPGLANQTAETEVTIVAKGKITEVRSVDTKDGKDQRVEIQLTDMDISMPATSAEGQVAEGFAAAVKKMG